MDRPSPRSRFFVVVLFLLFPLLGCASRSPCGGSSTCGEPPSALLLLERGSSSREPARR